MSSWLQDRGTRILSILRGGTGNATGTATVNANLTGPITSVGNATAVAAQTGTGSTFVMSAGPTLTGTLAAAAITASSTITPSQTIGIVGTTTNNSVQAGSVGEYIESEVLVASAVSLTTGTTANVTSISLTAGDWDVCGNVWTNVGGGTVLTTIEAAIGTVSATLPTRPGKGSQTKWDGSLTSTNLGVLAGTMRLLLSATTTVYLLVNAAFSTSTCAAYGFIGARRVR